MTNDNERRRGWPKRPGTESDDLQRKLRRLYGNLGRDPIPDHLRALAEELEAALRKRMEEAARSESDKQSRDETGADGGDGEVGENESAGEKRGPSTSDGAS
jgi:hypothetical protein